jgi:hypothetical protein
VGERDGFRAGALAGAGGAALVGLDAGEAAGAAGAPVLPWLLPALLTKGHLSAAGAGASRVIRLRAALLPIVLHCERGCRGFCGEIYARVLASRLFRQQSGQTTATDSHSGSKSSAAVHCSSVTGNKSHRLKVNGTGAKYR